MSDREPLSSAIEETERGLSVVIPTYNRSALLAKALGSVQGLRIPPGWRVEIVVVDNNSNDATYDVVASFSETCKIPTRYVQEKQQGLVHARNRGLKEAAFEHIAYLDDDMLVESEWLEGYVNIHDLCQPDAVVGPVYPWYEEATPEWLSEEILSSVTSAYSLKGSEATMLTASQAHQLPGCNFAVRKSAAIEVGGFNPSLGRTGKGMLGGEDWEFGERLVRAGKKVAYSPKCAIRHYISRQKISQEGLRARWRGFGATKRARMALRGETLAFGRWTRLFVRMIRYWVKGKIYRLFGRTAPALSCELDTERIRGLLFRS